ncbi:MAG: hypothetical protein P8Y95_17360 [Gammaproteobacteria bacterium]|jgi:hypothetical protein
MSDLKTLVKGKMARFVYYRDKALHYETDDGFLFPVPVEDAGSATFNAEEKAILMMRYIRKHLENVEKARES